MLLSPCPVLVLQSLFRVYFLGIDVGLSAAVKNVQLSPLNIEFLLNLIE